MDALSEKQIDYQDDDSCRHHNEEVNTELITQAAPLCLGGHNRRIGDEGEVVAKEGTAHDDSRHHSHIGIRLSSHSRGNGY